MTSSKIETVEAVTCCSCGSRETIEIARSRDFEYDTCSNEFRFARCSACGVVRLIDRPSITALEVIYPPEYIPHRFEEHLGPFIARVRAAVQGRRVRPLRALFGADAFIVDVGPGDGELLRSLRAYGPSSWRLLGVDFSATAVETLRTSGFEAVHSRFESLVWDLEPPDAVIMNQVIEHLEDPAAAAARAFEMLAPGGLLVVETPSTDAWDARLFRRRYWGGWHTPRHWVLFEPATLSAMLERVGFEVIETTPLLSPNFWLQSIHHAVSERWRAPRLAAFFDVSHVVPLAAASGVDIVQRAVRGRTSNFRMVGRKPAG